MRIVLLALLVSLVAPTSAQAKLATDADRLIAFTPVAAATYPSACAGHVTVNLNADAALATEAARTGGGIRLAQAHGDGSCVIDMSSGMDSARFCKVLLHEYGHLAGREHDDSHPNVMSGHADFGSVPQCDRAVAASITDYDRVLNLVPSTPRLIKAVRRGTPTYTRGWRWIVYTISNERWMIRGTGDRMTGEWTGSAKSA